ncbi:MAG: hypothetical protein AAGA54_32335 [Myxococcota bacterium]
MSKPAIDIAQLVNRREQLAYEHHLARTTYAYGVDLRRAAWLGQSTVGDPLMRSVDRRWNELITGLSADVLEPSGQTLSTGTMDELLGLVRMLHTPWASIRVLKPSVAEQWPIVTPLGTTKGGSHWLIVDRDRLQSLPASERAFLLASGLSHLQCDHGPLFAAHLMAHRAGRGVGLVRTLLHPWSRVATFSADRAGLLAVGDLDEGREALRAHADPGVDWLPPAPDLVERARAMEDFSKSRLLTRLRLSGPKTGWSLAPRLAQPNEDAANASAEKAPDAEAQDAPAAADPAAEETSAAPKADDPVAEAEAAGERLAAEQEREEAAREKQENDLAEARAREKALAEAWSLARCDQRLTRRLGLL